MVSRPVTITKGLAAMIFMICGAVAVLVPFPIGFIVDFVLAALGWYLLSLEKE